MFEVGGGCAISGAMKEGFVKVRALRTKSVQSKVLDDILSLRHFLCNFVTFWSSQGNLSNTKSRKTEENDKEKRVTISLKRDTI